MLRSVSTRPVGQCGGYNIAFNSLTTNKDDNKPVVGMLYTSRHRATPRCRMGHVVKVESVRIPDAAALACVPATRASCT